MDQSTRTSTYEQTGTFPFGPMDRAFLALRIVVLAGGLGWLLFAPLTRDDKIQALIVFLFYSFYNSALYVSIFYNPRHIRAFYLVGIIFDLIFILLLLMLTGGAASSFFIAFYILVALHSLYYGLKVGLIVSSASSLIYLVSYVQSGYPIHWTDFGVRILLLFMLSVWAGILSGIMREDRERIGRLNRDLRESFENLERAQKQLIETAKLAALGRMTSDVAHEIRNPLVSIGGFARRCHAMIDPGAPEKRYAGIVVDEVARLEKILRDLLIFSRGPARQPTMTKIGELLAWGLERVREEMAEKGIRVVQDIPVDVPDILADGEQLRQAFMNIILNAVQALEPGGVLTLRASTEKEGEAHRVCVEIEDTGCGISEEHLPLIFNPFFSTKNAGEGTGLGLSVSRRIVEEMGGRIDVSSNVGEGSRFRILIPVSAEAQVPALPEEERAR